MVTFFFVRSPLLPPPHFAAPLVALSLRLYAAGNMLWGGQAIRLRVETEVAVPLGFAMRWLASLTARGGVYYPYSDTVAVSGKWKITLGWGKGKGKEKAIFV